MSTKKLKSKDPTQEQPSFGCSQRTEQKWLGRLGSFWGNPRKWSSCLTVGTRGPLERGGGVLEDHCPSKGTGSLSASMRKGAISSRNLYRNWLGGNFPKGTGSCAGSTIVCGRVTHF